MKSIKLATCTVLFAISLPAPADIVHNDDVIITFSLCVGNDCVNGESFGFDTIRLKENNTRLHFDDTSTSASFPRNDWRIVANDSTNGGGSYLAIEDSTAGRQVFRVEAGARANALYVEDDGDIGIGTSTPAVDIDVKTGNTPTLRLQQDGSSGFAAHTWDVAGNEAGFFIRDATSGSTLPLRIRPGAPSSAIDIAAGGNVGIGASSPSVPLHVRRTNNSAAILVEEASGSPGFQNLLELKNGSGVGLVMSNTAGNSVFVSVNNPANAFTINWDDGANTELSLNEAGDLTIEGNIFSATCITPCAPDYVFAPDYELMPLGELEAFIERENHLPNVPSADELVGPVNLNEMQMRLLEKIEELTLYTIEQDGGLRDLRAENEALRVRLADLEQALRPVAE